jgi:type IV pilus secretin PilQ/predicted competence protein
MGFKKRCCSIAVAVTATSICASMHVRAESRAGETASKTPTSAKTITSTPSSSRTTPQSNPIAVAKSTESDQISIATGAAEPKFTVHKLSSPARLVVDIEDTHLGPSRVVSTASSSRLKGIRVGAHPSKSRVVIDLKDTASVQHEAQVRDGRLVVTVLSTGNSSGPVTASSTQTPTSVGAMKVSNVRAAPKSAPVPAQKVDVRASLDLDEEVVAHGGSLRAAELDVVAPKLPSGEDKSNDAQVRSVSSGSTEKSPMIKVAPVAVEAPAKISSADVQADRAQPKANIVDQAAGEQKAREVSVPETRVTKGASDKKADVHAASLDKDAAPKAAQSTSSITNVSLVQEKGAKPAVVVGIKGSPQFSLDRTAPSEYVLKIRDTSVSAIQKKQTLFASKDATGIRSVRTADDRGDALVRIFTQPSSYLTVRRSDDGVVVEETQDLAEVARDIRAQMAPVQDDPKGADVHPVVAGEKVDQKAKKDIAPAQPAGTTAKDVAPAKESKQANAAPTEPKATDANKDGELGEVELAALKGNSSNYTGRLISLDLQDADIDSALRIIAEVSNLNIVAGDGVAGKVTLKLVDVPWDQALDVILKSHGLDKVLEGNVMRVAPVDKLRLERESLKQARVAEEELESLSVKYMRVSYAKASEIKALVETVLSERGSVAFDERSNQLIVKDVRKGLQNVSELVKKIDLRTPQILLETQIVEANRNLSRQLGSELGFQYIQSPATGNGTGLNFPAAVAVGGSADTTNPSSITGSAFPVATSAALGSAVTMLFDSADGTKSLSLRLSQLEQEGQVRIISKPAVATTNNKPAEIKSVEKFRVKLPNGGLSIATGSGAQSSGSGDIATQTIEAGIVLNVTPQASPDYYILLDINAKSSTFGSREVDGIPNEIERSASSSVLVSSGQTFALGGIYKIVERDTVAGVPFFKDIPVLGTFFRNMSTDGSDEELLFFITPRIVEGSFEDPDGNVNR